MRGILACIVFSAPMMVHAQPTDPDEWVKSLVWFKGIYLDGDIKGTAFSTHLFIDERYGTADSDSSPARGLYTTHPDATELLFVGRATPRPANEWATEDRVAVGDGAAAGHDTLLLRDWDVRRADGLLDGLELSIETPRNIIDGDGLGQNFHVRPGSSGDEASGFFEFLVGAVRERVNFAVQGLTMRSQVCRRGS